MKKALILSFLTALFLTQTGFSQQMGADPELDSYLTRKGITKALPGTSYTGSAYLQSQFQRGVIYKDGEIMDSQSFLRYNVLRDEIEVKPGINAADEQARILRKSDDLYVKILNHLYVFEAQPGNEGAKPGYFEVLLEGTPYSLYQKHRKEYIEGKKSINSISADIRPNFKDREILYIVDKSGTFTELPGSRNGKLKQFGKDRKMLKRYTKDNDLNINREKDLVELIEHYNSQKSK